MTKRDGKVLAEGYLVFVVDSYPWNGTTHIRGVRIDRFRATKPSLRKGEIPLKVKYWFAEEQLKEAIPVVESDVTAFSVAFPEPEAEIENDPTAVLS